MQMPGYPKGQAGEERVSVPGPFSGLSLRRGGFCGKKIRLKGKGPSSLSERAAPKPSRPRA